MTRIPITIDEDTNLTTARKLLRENRIRHLPVVHEGQLTGILSERDTRLVALVPDIVKVGVADVMTRNPLTVSEETPVTEAVAKMVVKKYGCVIVIGEAGRIAGIFTSQDALRLLLRERQRGTSEPTEWPLRENVDDEDPGDLSDCLE